MQTALLSLFSLLVVLPSVSASKWSSPADLLQFENLGYSGYYYPVTKIEALDNGNCSCEKGHPFTFSGPLAPLNEELTVHFRGPMNLKKFAYYVTPSYGVNQTTGTWERKAYYDASSGTANNVTFLANYGHENECLGNATDYVSSDGLKKSNESVVLDDVTIPSAKEFAIASDIKCDGVEDCGAYRTDGQAYHGFYGVNKMFLFEFNAPSDTSEDHKKNKTDGYDMPAIWLLNAQILRTSQYPLNGNCSSWNSGSGEFDIFEVMNVTERNHFYSTIHTYQGTDDIGTGIQNFGFLERTPGSTMKGGVVFGEDSSATVFLSNDTSIDSSIDNSDLNSWILPLAKEVDSDETLSSITISPPSLATSTSATGSSVSSISKTKKNDAADLAPTRVMASLGALLGLLSLW